MKHPRNKIHINTIQKKLKGSASLNQFHSNQKVQNKQRRLDNQGRTAKYNKGQTNHFLTDLFNKVTEKQSRATNNFMSRLIAVDSNIKSEEKSLDVLLNKTEKSKSQFNTKIVNSTINPTKVRTISQKKQQINYPKPKFKPKIVAQQPKYQQQEIKKQKLKQALNRKKQLMQQLRRIDSQLGDNKKHQKSGLIFQIDANQNSSKNVTVFNGETSRINSFTNQFSLKVNFEYKNTKSGLSPTNSPIKMKEDIAYSVPNHNKAVTMLQKINNEKMRRQQRLVSDMKKKQDQQLKKMKEIEQQKHFQYEQKQKRRAQRIEAYMKRSMLNPLKNLSEKQSQVFQKGQKKPRGKVEKATFLSSKASDKAKFNSVNPNLQQQYQNQYIDNKDEINMDNSAFFSQEALQNRKMQVQLLKKNNNTQNNLQNIDFKLQQTKANDTLPATLILNEKQDESHQRQAFTRMKSLADQEVYQEQEAQFQESRQQEDEINRLEFKND